LFVCLFNYYQFVLFFALPMQYQSLSLKTPNTLIDLAQQELKQTHFIVLLSHRQDIMICVYHTNPMQKRTVCISLIRLGHPNHDV